MLDMRGETYQATSGYRSTFSKVIRFSPADENGITRAGVMRRLQNMKNQSFDSVSQISARNSLVQLIHRLLFFV
ncbi:MAG: hypothetical protein E5W94_04835 [Mesorhizobium sp.]|nr:MAG: hypothetical protein E5W94_04835 [Mesorhizobium sp.]